MGTTEEAPVTDMYTEYGDHYIAVNEAGRLRSKPPMWQPSRPFPEAYQRPMDKGIENGHLVFFIHGGLNDLDGVIKQIKRFSTEFADQPWHLIHLAWDTGWGSALNDIIGRLRSWMSWKNILRLLSIVLPWNWFGIRRVLLRATAYFGGIIWKREYDTAVAATRAPGPNSQARDRGFYRAFNYLNDAVTEGDGVRISFVTDSAGSIVANYLLTLIATEFTNLAGRVSNYIPMAPACHATHFQDSLSPIQTANQTVVMTLTPELEEADNVGPVYDKSLLWAIHDLFELGWKRKELTRFHLPIRSEYPIDHLWNRAILGIEVQIAELESRDTDPLDRGFGGTVSWAQSNETVTIGGKTRVWTESPDHSTFDSDPVTLESIKMLLS